MTTWMAPAGMVLIVGGITTLIVFRGFLFGAAGKARDRSAARTGTSAEAVSRAGTSAEAASRAGTSAEAASRAAARAERRARAAAAAAAEGIDEAVVTGRKSRRGRGTRAVEASAAAGSAAVVAGAPSAEVVPDARFVPLPQEGGELPGGDPELDVEVDLDRVAEPAPDEEDETALVLASAEQEPGPNPWDADRSGLNYGDRVDGWVRPDYPDEPGVVAGDYWTPAPERPYDARYGWPIPVERLQEVPPSTHIVGFDPPPEAAGEPLPEAPQWPPSHPNDEVQVPRSWPPHSPEAAPAVEESKSAFFPDAPPRIPPGPYAAREEILEGPIWRVPDLPESDLPDLTWSVETFADDGPGPRSRRSATVVRRRRGITSAPSGTGGQEPTQALPQLDPQQQSDLPTRTRPRPRPRPGAAQPDPRSTVYVSRHAAEPS